MDTMSRRQFLASTAMIASFGPSIASTSIFRQPPAWFRPGPGQITAHFESRTHLDFEVLIGRDRSAPMSVAGKTSVSGRGFVSCHDPDLTGRCLVGYRYRTNGPWTNGPVTPITLGRSRAETSRIAVLADGHLPATLSNAGRRDQLEATIDAVLDDQPDLVIFLGDEVGLQRSDAVSANRAWFQWRRTYSRLLERIPSVFVLGNHEGEAGYRPADARAAAQRARFRYLCNPSANDESLQNYFSFELGDALFIVLDVSRYTRVEPVSPKDWTLGEVQLAWFRSVLANSNARWKFVLGHHVIGGWSFDGQGRERGAAYGRGGAVYARVGEQSQVTAAMHKHRAQFFLYGHDHIVHQDSCDDVNFICCGRSSYLSTDARRLNRRGWQEAYGGGNAWRSGKLVSCVGFMRLTIAPERVDFEYIRTADDPSISETVGKDIGENVWQHSFAAVV